MYGNNWTVAQESAEVKEKLIAIKHRLIPLCSHFHVFIGISEDIEVHQVHHNNIGAH